MTEPGLETLTCFRHPDRSTQVRCTRCERPICPECMIQAPVGFQCPACVEEAREAFRSGGGGPVQVRGGQGARSAPPATRALLITLVAIFGLQMVFGSTGTVSLVNFGALQPYLVASGEWWRLFTAMFLHASLLHIAFNGYALFLFGSMVENIFGWRRFLGIYMITGFLASVTTYAFGRLDIVGVGASGAIFGVFGAFVAYNLRRRNTPQGRAALRWAATLILLNTVLALGISNVDWRAHLGGLVAGIVVGWAIEGFGTGALRRWSPLLGTSAAVVVGLVILVQRTAEIRALDIFQYVVR